MACPCTVGVHGKRASALNARRRVRFGAAEDGRRNWRAFRRLIREPSVNGRTESKAAGFSMVRLLRRIALLPRLLLEALVRIYQYVLSPHIPSSCRYTPTCSEYAVQALRRYGAVRGSILTAHRLLRCHPWGGHGFDPPRWYGEAEAPRRDGATEAQHERDHHRRSLRNGATDRERIGDAATGPAQAA